MIIAKEINKMDATKQMLDAVRKAKTKLTKEQEKNM